MFFLLYKHTDDGVFVDFPNISDHFPKISEDFPKLFQRMGKIDMDYQQRHLRKIRLNFSNRLTVTQPSFLYSNLFRRISFQYLLSSHLTLIAGIHYTIRVALIADFALPQVTVVSDFGVAGMTATCETAVRVCTCVLAWVVQTLVHICNKEKQVLYGNV